MTITHYINKCTAMQCDACTKPCSNYTHLTHLFEWMNEIKTMRKKNIHELHAHKNNAKTKTTPMNILISVDASEHCNS